MELDGPADSLDRSMVPAMQSSQQFGRRSIGRVELTAFTVLPYQAHQLRLERLLHPGVIASEPCLVRLAQTRRIRDARELDRSRVAELQRPGECPIRIRRH